MTETLNIKLGVNIDHIATLRNARGEDFPDPIKAAEIALNSGADSITAHLREDRRHIKDEDIENIVNAFPGKLNLEIAANDEMKDIALDVNPFSCCIVPERREEVTTEGGLDVVKEEKKLAHFITPLRDKGSRVSIFIAADENQIRAASRIGAQVVELHTGAYCDLHYEKNFTERDAELSRLKDMATFAHSLGLEVHAGHGLTYETVTPIAELPEVIELNIGHFLIGESIFTGLKEAIIRMRDLMDKARL